jgi:FKBP-type peptidyl-prolyl cis-trans isomerase
MKVQMRRMMAGGLLVALAACAPAGSVAIAPETVTFAPSLNVDLASMQRLRSGVYIRDLREGTGPGVRRGDRVAVRYAGWTTNGTLFDALAPPSQPREFRLGDGQVISGWEDGLAGMKPGGQRQLVIPASEGYGGRRVGAVPPHSTLVFLIELVAVR